MNVMDVDYRLSVRTAITISLSSVALLVILSTILFSDGSLAIGADAIIRLSSKVVSLCVLGNIYIYTFMNMKTYLQMLIKCAFLPIACKKIYESFRIVSEIYESNRGNNEIWPTFDAFMKTLLFARRIFLCQFFIVKIIFVLFKFIVLMAAYFVSDTRYLLYPSVLPRIPIESADNYELTMIFQLFMSIITCAISLYFDALFAIQMLHVGLMAEIIQEKTRTIDRMASVDQPSRPQIRENLRNVIALQNKMRE